MAKWPKPIFALLSALALIVTANIAPQVLCLAPNGHTAIESIMTGCHGMPDDDCRPSTSRHRSKGCEDITVNHFTPPAPAKHLQHSQPQEIISIIPVLERSEGPRPETSTFPAVPPLERKTLLLI